MESIKMNIKNRISEFVKENILNRKGMFVPLICVLTFVLVGYAAADEEKPVIHTDILDVEYGDSLDLDEIDITDNRDSRNDIKVEIENESVLNLNQLGSYSVVVKATDKFNNVATKSITINVNDSVAPQFMVEGAGIGYYVEVPYGGSNEISSYIKAIDNYDGDVTPFIQSSATLDTSTLGIQSITLMVSDTSNNTTSENYYFAVDDYEAPVITMNEDSETVKVDYASTFDVLDYLTITDNFDTEVKHTLEGEIDTSKIGNTAKLKVTATDSKGNESTKEFDAVVADISGPVISLTTSSTTVKEGASFDPKAYLTSAIDNLDGDVTSNVTYTNINTSSLGNQTVTYSVSDKAGNTSTATLKVYVDGGIGQKITDAALAQVGVKQDCTMLVTNALRAVGIYHHGWPISYFSLGHQIPASQAKAGDLIYYANGGQGLAHIAVYIGNGMSVHGGWNGNTVVYRYNYSTCSTPIFIRID